MNKVRIGILCKELINHDYWELDIFNSIIEDKRFEIVLLIKDGRTIGTKSYITRALTTKNKLGKFIFHLHNIFERFLFKNEFEIDSVISKKNRSIFNSIKTIHVNPLKKGYLDIFDKNDCEKIKKFNLDVILRHNFEIIKGEIFKTSKFGIWSFHHGDNDYYRGRPAGFWEIVYKESSVGVTLQVLNENLDSGLIIDKAFYNTHWSFVKTNQLILNSSTSLLLKNLKILYKQGKINAVASNTYFNKLFKVPNYFFALKYVYSFYRNFFYKIYQKLFTYFNLRRFHAWTLSFSSGRFIGNNLYKTKFIKLPKNQFWADPFLFKNKKKLYVFFENYSYSTKKGVISCGEIIYGRIKKITDVLIKDYHLSYPFVFEYDNEIYMIPETSNNNRLELYICRNFPNEWELINTKFEGEKIIDATIHIDSNNQIWLFVNKQRNKYSSPHSDLYIYKVLNLKKLEMISHSMNPVIIDSRVARPAGPFFKHENFFIRPSQLNCDGIYGRGINLNKVVKLNLNEYEEEKITTIKPYFKKNLMSIHHLHQLDDCFIFDVAHRKI